jgi:hypothetical protein
LGAAKGGGVPGQPPVSPPPPPVKQEFDGPASCDKDPPTPLPAANYKFSVIIDDSTPWRPALGDVKFKVVGSGFSDPNVDIVACMRWRVTPKAQGTPKPGQTPTSRLPADPVQTDGWFKSPSLRLAETAEQNTTAFVATVPNHFRQGPNGLIDRVFAQRLNDSSALGLVPLADFRVVAKTRDGSSWSYIDVPQSVGITFASNAFWFATILVLVAATLLWLFGTLRKVPGSRNVILKIISTRSGYASLSQLQILLWTFVVGWSAAYVLALSGNLIAMSNGTLVLLGISGLAVVGSKLQQATETSIGNPPPRQPEPAIALTALPLADKEMLLRWLPSSSGPRPDSYRIMVAEDANPTVQTVFSSNYRGISARIANLKPGTLYVFQVIAQNDAGDAQPPAECKGQTGTASVAGIGPVTGFGPTDKVKNTSAELAWTPFASAKNYKIQYRRRRSADNWSNAQPIGKTGALTWARLVGLDAKTLYDLRITASANATWVDGPQWTYASLTTDGPREPIWSDLIIAQDGTNEIDVSRVQMLFFTVVVALFVLLRVITSGTIPEIPEAFQILMGISNTVYLTSKLIRD